MIVTDAINLTGPERLMVTWDTGRRCNFDCSYCEISRHDNISSPHSYEELLRTFKFVKEYTSIYADLVNINFTGGEPTVNPAFWQLAEYIKNNETRFRLSLTTNGAWHPKNTDRITELFEGVTVSYHTEGHSKLKQQTLDNIKLLHAKGIWLQVNVMLHTDNWDEGVAVCEELKELGITHNPRPIGDGNAERKGWFTHSDGSQRRTTHDYTDEQQNWFFDYTNMPKPVEGTRAGTELGRKCCGGRCLKGKVNNKWQEVTMVDTHFKDWFCSVNKYFLHIDQHTGSVYHHQTCQALHNGLRGPLGNLSNTDAIIEYANKNKNETIVCPNLRCGCGMCVPKAKSFEDYKEIIKVQSY
jgi:MoaA/NifB/PqqE/SkfB family radical SAM enzyme